LSDTPDEIVDHQPHKCQHCGETLQDIASQSFIRRQIVDIPPVVPIYTEHRFHVKTCPHCGLENREAFADNLQAPIQYGKRVQAMVGYLSVYQSLPYKRMCDLFKDFLGLSLSQGSVDNFLDNLERKAEPVYDKIKSSIRQSQVVGADETGCRVNGHKHWFHVWQNSMLTFIASFGSRGCKAIDEHFSDGFKDSVYVSDCWASQLKVEAKEHQLCLAHLLRELNNFVENIDSQWSLSMKTLFKRALELKKQMTTEDYLTPSSEVVELNKELDQLLKVDYSTFHKKEKAFFKRLLKHRQSIFTFLYYPQVPPDNNASERAIRNVKVKTKISGQFRNADGKSANRYAKIRSVIESAIKNKQNVFWALENLDKIRFDYS
jgi:transposase